jgi:putative transposase
MLISIPPKCAVSEVVGFIKRRSAIYVACAYGKEAKSGWPKLPGSGVFVSIVGRDEAVIREYIKNQEAEDNRLEQWNLWRQRLLFTWPSTLGPRQRPRQPL